MSSDESYSLNDESDDDGSDSGSSSTYYFPDFSLCFDYSVVCFSGLGSGVFVATGVQSKCDIFAFVVFVTIGVESRVVDSSKCFVTQTPCYLYQFETQFIVIVMV